MQLSNQSRDGFVEPRTDEDGVRTHLVRRMRRLHEEGLLDTSERMEVATNRLMAREFPPCPECGALTVRNGPQFQCENCGTCTPTNRPQGWAEAA